MESLPMEVLIKKIEDGANQDKLISEWGIEMVEDALDWIRLSE